ncbi:MAG: UPF0182 family protein [Acidimicrobiales bacterium]
MRRPSDVPPPAARINPRGHRRLRIWIIVAIVVIIVLLASLRTLATFYTDYLWFGSVHQPAVWRGILGVKLSLFLVFAAVFFVVLWVNLAIVDRMTPSMLTLGPEDELVRRYQHIVTPRAFLVRTIVSIVIALIAASSTIGQWQNWLLYVHAVPFGVKDPEFHKDISFFVFKLPFIQFVIGWVFASLVVITIITAVAHYLNGGIRPQGRPPRVAPQVKVHLSVLVAVIAVVKAVGYYYQRFTLDFSSNGYVQGAAYTDVHARLPAISMLFWISLLAAVILLVNIRSRGWLLPVLAVGLWAFVAIVVGAIYPAVVQALKVTPAQSTLELPYIQRNIQATQAAYNLTSSNVTQESYAATQSLTSSEEQSNAATFSDIRLWDPESSLTGATYAKLQQERSFFQFNTQALDRYEVNGTVTPTIVAVRQVNSSNLPAQGWVNSHLEYTHGYGMIASPANVQTSSGTPSFSPGIQNVPPTSDSYPSITQPDVYFGVNSPGYVIADTKQAEIDYQDANGQNHYSTYSGTGGVQLNSFLKRAAFAIRFGDLNVLISDLITPDSRMMFVRDIQAEVNKVAPFLSLDSDPYPVIVNGDIDWVQDAYTTTGNYPYAQDADTSAVSSNSGLSGLTFNYIRNSVKVVINAYTGNMTFYVMDPQDPIIRTWMAAFPSLFTPESQMPAALQDHLRYPEDIFTVQTAMYGRYHIDKAAAFYNAGDAWSLSESAGAGSPTAALQNTVTTNAQGQSVVGQVVRMAPIYQVLQIPGEPAPSFNIMEAYVPVSQNDSVQTLAGFVFGDCDYGPDYGKLTVFETPAGVSIDGPALVDARILANTTVSQKITLLNSGGSSVVLGNLLVVPVDGAILYFRPLYVQGRNSFPVLQEVIGVYGGQGSSQVYMEPTLSQTLSQIFGTTTSPTTPTKPTQPPPSTQPVSGQERVLISQAYTLSLKIQADLRDGNLGQYQADVNQLNKVIAQLNQLTAKSKKGTSTTTTTSPTTTTTTSPTTSTTTSTTSTSGTTTTSSVGTTNDTSGTRSSPSTTTDGVA